MVCLFVETIICLITTIDFLADPKHAIMLLSNDKNLRNKALVCKLQAYSAKVQCTTVRSFTVCVQVYVCEFTDVYYYEGGMFRHHSLTIVKQNTFIFSYDICFKSIL